jgi:hypothetical protein
VLAVVVEAGTVTGGGVLVGVVPAAGVPVAVMLVVAVMAGAVTPGVVTAGVVTAGAVTPGVRTSGTVVAGVVTGADGALRSGAVTTGVPSPGSCAVTPDTGPVAMSGGLGAVALGGGRISPGTDVPTAPGDAEAGGRNGAGPILGSGRGAASGLIARTGFLAVGVEGARCLSWAGGPEPGGTATGSENGATGRRCTAATVGGAGSAVRGRAGRRDRPPRGEAGGSRTDGSTLTRIASPTPLSAPGRTVGSAGGALVRLGRRYGFQR